MVDAVGEEDDGFAGWYVDGVVDEWGWLEAGAAGEGGEGDYG